VTAGRVIRWDTVIATSEDASGRDATTTVSLLMSSWKVSPKAAVFTRFGLVRNSPEAAEDASALVNVAVGGVFSKALSADFRAAGYLAVALPVGMGGGNSPDPGEAAAVRAAVLARSAMDNAMFAVNDLVVFPGIDVAFVRDGWTVQGEATLLRLNRVRGKDVQVDAFRTNFTSGLNAGYFLTRNMSVGTEVRYQRWLSTPASVRANPKTRDTATFAIGPRLNLKVSPRIWFRPGIAWVTGLDDPMAANDYSILQIDLPVAF
jgi:hypothetical protein